MKKRLLLISTLSLLLVGGVFAQSGEVQTVFGGSITATGYGALTNKFTFIRGEFANMTGAYGGIYLNHRFLIGVSASAVTNNIRVPGIYSVEPDRDMSYEYGQVGMINEYVVGSDKPVHFAFSLFTGAGFTVQYERHILYQDTYAPLLNQDEDWSFVMEPGAQVEVNLLRWMRFSTGVSYRSTFGAKASGIDDGELSNMSYNIAFKFGKF